MRISEFDFFGVTGDGEDVLVDAVRRISALVTAGEAGAVSGFLGVVADVVVVVAAFGGVVGVVAVVGVVVADDTTTNVVFGVDFPTAGDEVAALVVVAVVATMSGCRKTFLSDCVTLDQSGSEKFFPLFCRRVSREVVPKVAKCSFSELT